MTGQNNGLTERALERRLKRHLLKEIQTFYVSCPPGFEFILEKEILALGTPGSLEKGKGGITLTGDLSWMYRLNLSVPVAGRVLLRIGTFTCKSYPELFDKIQRLPWELFLGRNPVASFRVSAGESRLHHTGNIAKTTGDAIREYYRQWPEQIVSLREEAPLQVVIRFLDDICTVSLDTTGDHLHRRGYKPFSVEAPLRETLAAGLLEWAGADRFPVILDPFCGSGTFLFEALRMRSGPFPGEDRVWAFQSAPFFQEPAFRKLKPSRSENPAGLLAVGSDLSASALEAARKNSAKAGVKSELQLSVQNAAEIANLWPEPGLIISNPPYGKRIGSVTNSEAVLGQFFHQVYTGFPGWTWCLIVPEETRFPWKNLKELRFSNGGLAVKAVLGVVPR